MSERFPSYYLQYAETEEDEGEGESEDNDGDNDNDDDNDDDEAANCGGEPCTATEKEDSTLD